MRIAIASSGLGHVARGIETWARDTAVALAARGADVTLFAGGEVSLPAVPGERAPSVVVLPGVRRFDARTARRIACTPAWAWRWGLKDGYGWEQFSFWLALQRHLRRGRFDLLHVQDPLVAAWCRRWRTGKLLRTQEILAHGTEEPAAFLMPFPCVQHLAPWHLEVARQSLPTGEERPYWASIPNFVDTAVFKPAADASARAATRQRLGLPSASRVVGCVAVVKRDHKRIDHLIREFAAYAGTSEGRDAHLVIAGARHPDADALVAEAEVLAPGHVHVVFDWPRSDMPALYQALDVFALTSVFEMMPIALLEALASGVPALVHRHPVLEWMIGNGSEQPPGGLALDMAREGELAATLRGLTPDWLARQGGQSRQQAESRFAHDVVIDLYLQYYRRIVHE